jgi:hypothetical protein
MSYWSHILSVQGQNLIPSMEIRVFNIVVLALFLKGLTSDTMDTSMPFTLSIKHNPPSFADSVRQMIGHYASFCN